MTSNPQSNDEQELDTILGNIDRLVDHQCKKATDRQKALPDDPPTKCKKTKAALQQLSESKLVLDESGEDLPVVNNAAAPARKRFWPWVRTALE